MLATVQSDVVMDGGRLSTHRDRVLIRCAWIAFAVCGGASAGGTLLYVLSGRHQAIVAGEDPWMFLATPEPIIAIFFGLAGAVIATHRPRNLVAWLLLGTAMFSGAFAIAVSTAMATPGTVPAPLTSLAAWVATWAWFPAFALATTLLLLIFPDGRLPSRRWRPLAVASAVIMLAGTLLAMVAARSVAPFAPGAARPLGVVPAAEALLGPAIGLLTVCGLLAAVAVVVRARRSDGVQRQQVKWFAYAAALMVVTIVIRDTVGDRIPALRVPATVAVNVAVAFVPAAIAIAILRHRLFEIDRLISRTVSWAALTGLLVAAYLLSVGLVFRPLTALTGGSDLTVAAATLTVAAAFRPARDRLQTAVDRRFNRSRYDAERALARLRGRMRDHLDVDELRGDVLATVARTMQPTHASVWLRIPGR